jgi:hypothetical protein
MALEPLRVDLRAILIVFTIKIVGAVVLFNCKLLGELIWQGTYVENAIVASEGITETSGVA